MSVLNIYIDANYPKRIKDFLVDAHKLQKDKKFELIEWNNDTQNINIKSSIFMLIDYENRGLSVSTLKHFEAGYNLVVCKAGSNKLDLFEFLMTVFRVWPFILEKTEKEQDTFLYTFKYGGRKISKFKNVVEVV